MPWNKSFDVDEALARAGETFWKKGYEATSLTDLLAAMGIQKGSFYDTYGSKHQAYVRALEAYASERFDEFDEQVAGLGARAAFEALFDAIYRDCIGAGGRKGCMIINCALEMAPSDPEAQAIVLSTIRRHERLHADLIRRGQREGEIDESIDALAVGKALMGLVMGMRVYARAGAPMATIRALADQALALLDA